MHGEDHKPVQEDIEDRSRYLYGHGIFGSAILSNQHHSNALQVEEDQARQQPYHVGGGVFFQGRAAT